MLSWNQARVDVVETCSLASAGELSVLFTCGTRARWSSTTRAGLRAQFTALSQHFARVSVETIASTFYRHYTFCFYNGSKLLVYRAIGLDRKHATARGFALARIALESRSGCHELSGGTTCTGTCALGSWGGARTSVLP